MVQQVARRKPRESDRPYGGKGKPIGFIVVGQSVIFPIFSSKSN